MRCHPGYLCSRLCSRLGPNITKQCGPHIAQQWIFDLQINQQLLGCLGCCLTHIVHIGVGDSCCVARPRPTHISLQTAFWHGCSWRTVHAELTCCDNRHVLPHDYTLVAIYTGSCAFWTFNLLLQVTQVIGIFCSPAEFPCIHMCMQNTVGKSIAIRADVLMVVMLKVMQSHEGECWNAVASVVGANLDT